MTSLDSAVISRVVSPVTEPEVRVSCSEMAVVFSLLVADVPITTEHSWAFTLGDIYRYINLSFPWMDFVIMVINSSLMVWFCRLSRSYVISKRLLARLSVSIEQMSLQVGGQ